MRHGQGRDTKACPWVDGIERLDRTTRPTLNNFVRSDDHPSVVELPLMHRLPYGERAHQSLTNRRTWDLERNNDKAAIRNKSGEGSKTQSRDHHRYLGSANMRGRSTKHDRDEPYSSKRRQNWCDTS